MATIVELEAGGALVRLDPDLDADQLEQRCIYALPHVLRQIDRLVDLESDLGLDQSPLEQLDDMVSHFAAGGEMAIPRQFHSLQHRREDVWEIKTPDLRLMGWFHRRDCFVCTSILRASLIKGQAERASSGQLYSGLCEEAARYRDQIDLDPPKHVIGDHPENVVSNYTCS